MRVAVVDIGTNSTRLLIADVDAETGALSRSSSRDSQVTRLGDGRRRRRFAVGRGDRARTRTCSPTTAQRSTSTSCEANLAVLTSAVRDAANGADFAARVREEYRPRRARAERRRRGAADVPRRDVRPAARRSEPTVVIDIGGGSTEFVVGAGRTAGFHVSLHAGVVRMSERHIHTDPPDAARAAGARRRCARRRSTRGLPAAGARAGRARRSPSPAPPPRRPRSTRSSTPTTPSASTATRCCSAPSNCCSPGSPT